MGPKKPAHKHVVGTLFSRATKKARRWGGSLHTHTEVSPAAKLFGADHHLGADISSQEGRPLFLREQHFGETHYDLPSSKRGGGGKKHTTVGRTANYISHPSRPQKRSNYVVRPAPSVISSFFFVGGRGRQEDKHIQHTRGRDIPPPEGEKN